MSSSNSSSSNSSMLNPTLAYPPPPVGLNYIAAIRPSINMLLIGTVWPSTLIPLLCALFLFSTARLRRTPVFLLNVASILMGLAMGILNYYMEVTAIISPAIHISVSCCIEFGVLTAMLPIFTESILLARVIAVYPPRAISFRKNAIVYIPLLTMKIARLINIFLFWNAWFQAIGTSGGNPTILSQKSWNRPNQKIEWVLQVLDKGYSSSLFLYRLHQGRNVNSRIDTRRMRSSYAYRLNSLFWIAVSNFVFPVFLSLAQLVFAFIDTTYLDGAYVLFTNMYVEIIGVLLATVWSAGFQWSDSHSSGGITTALTAPQRLVVATTAFSRSTVQVGDISRTNCNGNDDDERTGIKLDKIGDNLERSKPYHSNLP